MRIQMNFPFRHQPLPGHPGSGFLPAHLARHFASAATVINDLPHVTQHLIRTLIMPIGWHAVSLVVWASLHADNSSTKTLPLLPIKRAAGARFRLRRPSLLDARQQLVGQPVRPLQSKNQRSHRRAAWPTSERHAGGLYPSPGHRTGRKTRRTDRISTLFWLPDGPQPPKSH